MTKVVNKLRSNAVRGTYYRAENCHLVRYTISLGTLFWSLCGFSWNVALTVAKPNLERHPDRFVVSPEASP